jgi:hypothetical protein
MLSNKRHQIRGNLLAALHIVTAEVHVAEPSLRVQDRSEALRVKEALDDGLHLGLALPFGPRRVASHHCKVDASAWEA